MKKKYLTYAGVISAVILMVLFFLTFFIKSPVLFLMPLTTFDPIRDQNVDANNILIISGKTNLPQTKVITPYVNPRYSNPSPNPNNKSPEIRGSAFISPDPGGWNSWSGTINISDLYPGDYEIHLNRSDFLDNYTRVIETGPISIASFTLGNDSCSDCIKKREPVSSPFIRINPITNPGDSLTFTGVTNLDPGTLLTYNIKEKTRELKNDTVRQEGSCMVYPGLEGNNRWLCTPDTFETGSGQYLFTIFAGTITSSGKNSPDQVSETREFTITGNNTSVLSPEVHSGLKNISSPYISIDDLPYMKTNNIYVISGTTNLPVGEILLFQLISPNVMKDYNVSINPRDSTETGNISGVAGCTRVENGYDEENLWAFKFETYFLHPGTYEVNVSNDNYEQELLHDLMGNVSKSEYFTLHP